MAAPTAVLGAASFAAAAATVAQSRINGELGVQLGNGIEAAWISFGVGLLAVGLVFLGRRSTRRSLSGVRASLRDGSQLRPWHLLGGLGGASVVAAQSVTVQYLGVAIFTVAVVAGQTGNSLVVDAAGLGPHGASPISVRRVLAALLAIGGVGVAVSSRWDEADFAIWAVAFCVIAGCLIAIQQAINARVARAAGTPWTAGLVNFIVGFAGLSVVLVVFQLLTTTRFAALPWDRPLLWVGGLIGVIFIVVAAAAVGPLGVLLFALLTIAGQITGALVLDVLFPAPGSSFSWMLVIGCLIVGAGVALASVSDRGIAAVPGTGQRHGGTEVYVASDAAAFNPDMAVPDGDGGLGRIAARDGDDPGRQGNSGSDPGGAGDAG